MYEKLSKLQGMIETASKIQNDHEFDDCDYKVMSRAVEEVCDINHVKMMKIFKHNFF